MNPILRRRTWLVLALVACGEEECTVPTDHDPFAAPPRTVRTVRLSPSAYRMLLGDSVKLQGAVGGNFLCGLDGCPTAASAFQWTSSNPAVVRVVSAGLMVAVGLGAATIRATLPATSDAEAASGYASIQVLPTSSLASMTLTPAADTIIAGQATEFRVIGHDAGGGEIGLWAQWSISDAEVASFVGRGQVRGNAIGTATISAATAAGPSATARLSVLPPHRFTSLSAGYDLACGVTVEGTAYCWGAGAHYMLGSTAPHEVRYRPVRVPIAEPLAAVSVGASHACALSRDGLAYCWGSNHSGQLGNGAPSERSGPVAVLGSGLRFIELDLGGFHSCGLTGEGAAYCWGSNQLGQLGTGVADTVAHPTPARVTAPLAFTSLGIGALHSCAVATTGAAYCWGKNEFGQLGTATAANQCIWGTGTILCSATPTAVAGDRAFKLVSASNARDGGHTCGIALDASAFCWGPGSLLGSDEAVPPCTENGASQPCSHIPLRVGGGHSFVNLTAGAAHTCGLLESGDVYCWPTWDGTAWRGATRVNTDLSFRAVAAGKNFTCGIATDASGYCWGDNEWGQLGHPRGSGPAGRHDSPVIVMR